MRKNSTINTLLRVCLVTLFILSAVGLSGCLEGFGLRSTSDGIGNDIFHFKRMVVGTGNSVRETRNLEHFSRVILSEEGDLQIKGGEYEQLMIEAEDNLLGYLVSEVNDGSLDIKKRPDNVQLDATKPIRYTLTVSSLDTLIVKNSGAVEITEVNGMHFKLKISGSGGVQINSLAVDTLDIEITGSGNLTISEGSVNEQTIRLSSSGNYEGKNVASKRAEVKLSSSGDATVNVLDSLIASTTSSGNIYYTGNPPQISIQAMTSSGRVIRY